MLAPGTRRLVLRLWLVLRRLALGLAVLAVGLLIRAVQARAGRRSGERPRDRRWLRWPVAVLAAVVVGGERAQVAAHCRAVLPADHRPVRWYTTDRVPATAAGKHDPVALRRAIETGEVTPWR